MAKAIIKQILAAPAAGQAFLAGRPRIAAGILVLLFLSLAIAGAGIVKPRDVDYLNPLSAFSSSDFDDYFQASKTLLKGEDPYRLGQINDLFSLMQSPEDFNNPLKLAAAIEKLKGVGTYLYPPFTAFLLMPLTALQYEVAAGLFQTFSLLALAGFLWFVYRLHRQLRDDDGPFWLAAIVATILLYRFLDGNAGNGNIGFFLILLCGGGLALIFRGSLLMEFAGGVLLGLATVMKITPGFFGLVLIGGRRLVAIAGMGVGAGIALVAPAIALGWQQNIDLFLNWYKLIVQTFSQVGFVRPWMNNQSISGAIGKLFIPASDMKQMAYGLPWGNVNGQEATAVFALGVKVANLALVALGIVVALVVAFRARGPQNSGLRTIDEMFSPTILRLMVLSTLISLLAAGVSWYHAYSILFIPVVIRLYRHWSGTSPLDWLNDKLDGAWLSLFGIFGILQSLLPRTAREGLAMYSVFAFLSFAMILWLAWRLLFPTRADDVSSESRSVVGTANEGRGS